MYQQVLGETFSTVWLCMADVFLFLQTCTLAQCIFPKIPYNRASSRALRFTAPDGESLDTRLDSQGTWCTLGLGGTYRTSHRTYLYGNVERSFGGDLQKKWQVNVGAQYQF